MGSKSRRQLEDCVQRILQDGDLNLMTESRVRMLAQKETGIDLTDRNNRRVVRQAVEEFFNREEPDDEDQAESIQTSNKAAATQGSLGRKRELQGQQRSPPAKPSRDRRKFIAELSDSDDVELDHSEEDRRTGTRPTYGRDGKQHDSDFDRNDVDLKNVREFPPRSERRTVVEPDDDSQDSDTEETDGSEEINEGKKSRLNFEAPVSNRRASNGTVAGAESDEDEDKFARGNDENSVLEEEERGGMKKVLMRRERAANRRDMSPESTELDSGSSDEEMRGRPLSRSKKHVSGSDRKRDLKVRDDEKPLQIQEVKKQRNTKAEKNDNGMVCQLSKNRWVAIQQFKGKALVSIREYYEKNGQMLPSTKGISLTPEQWELFKAGVPTIDAALNRLK